MFGSKLKVRRFEDRITRYESFPVQKGKIVFYGHIFSPAALPLQAP